MHDLVIKGGTVVDGTGTPGRTADVAITDGVVTEVGRVNELARETVDADGALVTPGFVDVHTHFDGQVTWDPLLTPTCWHGVTTVVMGNCGVGFAPVQHDRHEWLIGLMEGVEDIPGAALSAGIEWEWETFPEYLDAIERRPLLFDVGTQVPHGAVRAYVMGERGAKNEPATAADIEQMAELVREGIEAGALGFSTSRTIAHMAIDGEPVPGTFAAHDELFGIGRVLGELGTGVFELAPAGALGEDLAAPEREMAWMRELAAAIGRPVTFALTQNDHDPDSWSRMLELCARGRGRRRAGDAAGRGPAREPAARAPDVPPVRVLPVVGADRRGAARAEGRGDARSRDAPPAARRGRRRDRADAPVPRSRARVPVRRPCPTTSRHARAASPGIARAQGRAEMEVFYDVLMDDDGRKFVMRPLLNYSGFSLDAVRDDALAPDDGVGSRRRRRALRHDVRREHADVHAHALGTRPVARPAPARVRREQDDRADRRALRPRRPRCARAGHARRRQRDRLRRAAPAAPRARARPARPTPAGSCRARRATSRRSSAAP